MVPRWSSLLPGARAGSGASARYVCQDEEPGAAMGAPVEQPGTANVGEQVGEPRTSKRLAGARCADRRIHDPAMSRYLGRGGRSRITNGRKGDKHKRTADSGSPNPFVRLGPTPNCNVKLRSRPRKMCSVIAEMRKYAPCAHTTRRNATQPDTVLYCIRYSSAARSGRSARYQ